MNKITDANSIFTPIIEFIEDPEEQKAALKFYYSLDEGERLAFFKALLKSPQSDRLSVYRNFKTSFGR